VKYVLRYAALPGTVLGPKGNVDEGDYLKSYDPDAHDGFGHSEWTSDPAEALTFDNATDALALWKQPSTVRPLRPDGKPNRPLTAVSITVERLP
jgi:hypothetical protein